MPELVKLEIGNMYLTGSDLTIITYDKKILSTGNLTYLCRVVKVGKYYKNIFSVGSKFRVYKNSFDHKQMKLINMVSISKHPLTSIFL